MIKYSAPVRKRFIDQPVNSTQHLSTCTKVTPSFISTYITYTEYLYQPSIPVERCDQPPREMLSYIEFFVRRTGTFCGTSFLLTVWLTVPWWSRAETHVACGTIIGKFHHSNYTFQTANLNNRIDFTKPTGHHHTKSVCVCVHIYKERERLKADLISNFSAYDCGT